MTVVVLDASAAAELGHANHLGPSSAQARPSRRVLVGSCHLYITAGAAVRRMSLRGLINTGRADLAIAQLLAVPMTIVRSKPLLRESWAMRANLTVADAVDVVLARHLDEPLLTGDRRLAPAPNLGITVLHLSGVGSLIQRATTPGDVISVTTIRAFRHRQCSQVAAGVF